MTAIYLRSAARNMTLRNECMQKARRAIGAQRKFLAYCARRHNHLAVSYMRDARSFAS